MALTIRMYRPEDLGPVLRLWERLNPPPDGLSIDQAVDLMTSGAALTLVAERNGSDFVGVGIGGVSGVLGWIFRLTVADGDGVAQPLLEHLEVKLMEHGARKLVALVHDGDPSGKELERRGYHASQGIVYMERHVAASVPAASELDELGAEIVDPGLWHRLKGMDTAKQIIERGVILPLAEPELARRHGVSPQKAVMLFGPPGTGKTSFARGIASRLNWPFVEIQPGELAGEGLDRQAGLLAQAFEKVRRLSSAVVFVDEVEDFASVRQEQRKVQPSVTNEFLKQIPRMRETENHLLVCATDRKSVV